MFLVFQLHQLGQRREFVLELGRRRLALYPAPSTSAYHDSHGSQTHEDDDYIPARAFRRARFFSYTTFSLPSSDLRYRYSRLSRAVLRN